MSKSEIVKFPAERFLDAEPGKPAPAPIGDPISLIRSRSVAVDHGRAGIWTSSPGRWHRQIRAAEFCLFLEGECTFIPDGEPAIEVAAGDVLYFPENSMGVWDIKTECRKAFFVFDGTPNHER